MENCPVVTDPKLPIDLFSLNLYLFNSISHMFKLFSYLFRQFVLPINSDHFSSVGTFEILYFLSTFALLYDIIYILILRKI